MLYKMYKFDKFYFHFSFYNDTTLIQGVPLTSAGFILSLTFFKRNTLYVPNSRAILRIHVHEVILDENVSKNIFIS